MGFEEERSKRVLKHFKNNVNMAMDYMLNTPAENDAILNNNSSNSATSTGGGMNNSSSQSFVPNQEYLQML